MRIQVLSRIVALCLLPFMSLVAFASDVNSRSEIEKLIKAKGADLYSLAWPTAKYKTVEIEAIELLGNGANVTIVLRGNSAFVNAELWVRTLVELKDGKFVGLSWGEHSPALFKPGSTVSDLSVPLGKINEGRDPQDFRASPAQAEAYRKKWEAFDSRMKKRIADRSAKMAGMREKYKSGTIYLFNQVVFKTTPYCYVDVAIHYRALDGEWVTVGWWRVDHQSELGTWTDVMSIGPAVWLYAKTKKGPIWDGDRRNGSLSLPVIPDRTFMSVGDEELYGPDLTMVKFVRMERMGSSWGHETFNIPCNY